MNVPIKRTQSTVALRGKPMDEERLKRLNTLLWDWLAEDQRDPSLASTLVLTSAIVLSDELGVERGDLRPPPGRRIRGKRPFKMDWRSFALWSVIVGGAVTVWWFAAQGVSAAFSGGAA